jgi:tetratricopeptide (TPR) repeat protein
MLLADRPRQSLSTIPVSELVHYLTGANQQAFVRLRLALGLNLRRQLLIAVCDDLALRNAMAEKLAQDLPRLHDLSSFIPLELGSGGRSISHVPAAEQLLTLTLHPKDATTIGQVVQQLKHDPQRPKFGVQMLGIEQLTRQPVHIQRAFLNHLRAVGRNFVHLDANMLLWVTRPWLRSIQQSAPEFWRWRTGIFEFEGDPLPATALVNYPAITEKPLISQPLVSQTAVPAAALLPLIQSSVQRLTAPVRPIFEPDLAEPAPSNVTPVLDESLVATPVAQPSFTPQLLVAEPIAAPVTEPIAVPVTEPIADVAFVTELAELAAPIAPVRPIDDDLSHLEPSQEELDLADLVLAAVMQQVSRHPEALAQTETPNLEHASFEPIRILQQVEDLQQAAAVPDAFAAVYRELGDYYRNHHELTLQADPEVAGKHLTVGVKAYELAWKFLNPQDPTIPEIHNDIANLYWMLSRTPGEMEQSLSHLEQAIAQYQGAIGLVDPLVNPYVCAMLENNLGAAYSDLAVRRDPVENLNRSIAAYESALQKRPASVEPRRYAATQNNLGTAYWNLGQHQALVPNLQRAIRAYGEALTIYNPAEEPLHYAMIQNNIGTAYWNLAQCDLDTDTPDAQRSTTPEDLLKSAIAAYGEALQYRTRIAAPIAHAATQNNLGTAYWHLANQPATQPEAVQDCLLAAMTSYESAIATSEAMQQPIPFDLAATRNNLASAYHQAATNRHAAINATQRASYLDQALDQHLLALQVWEAGTDLYETALHGLVQTVRSIHEYQGSQGQTKALSKLPAVFLTSVMKSL